MARLKLVISCTRCCRAVANLRRYVETSIKAHRDKELLGKVLRTHATGLAGANPLEAKIKSKGRCCRPSQSHHHALDVGQDLRGSQVRFLRSVLRALAAKQRPSSSPCAAPLRALAPLAAKQRPSSLQQIAKGVLQRTVVYRVVQR